MSKRAIYARLRGSGTYGQDRLERPYVEKCLLEFSVSGAKWADDVQGSPETFRVFHQLLLG